MKILQISTMDYGGAGKAAYRLHLGLKSIGVDSKMLVLNRGLQDDDIIQIETPSNNNLVANIQDRIRKKLISFDLDKTGYKETASYDLFSDIKTLHNISQHPLVKEADIITLRWITGFVDYREFFSNVNKPIIWRLSDMNPFTGGCHYSNGCMRYLDGCGACPQLASKTPNDLSRKIFQKKESAYANKNIHIVTISGWHKDCARRSPLFRQFPVETIPNGLLENTFKKQDKEYSRDLLNLPRDKILILFGANSIIGRKGHRQLLKALRVLIKKVNPSHIGLVMFGRYMPLQEFEKESAFKVYRLGFIRDEVLLPAVYSSCDMFLMPSLEEAFGQMCLEAMACGTPPIGFEVGGIRDMIIPNKTGLLVQPGNKHDFADKIEYMVKHPEEREEMGKNAVRRVEQEYTMKKQAERYLKLYESILRKS